MSNESEFEHAYASFFEHLSFVERQHIATQYVQSADFVVHGPAHGEAVARNFFLSAIANAESCADLNRVFTFGCADREVDWQSLDPVARRASFGHQVGEWYRSIVRAITSSPPSTIA